MSAAHKKAVAEIRCGKFVATSADRFALSFRIQRLLPNGAAHTLTILGSMPVLITRWVGAGFPQHRQSLN